MLRCIYISNETTKISLHTVLQLCGFGHKRFFVQCVMTTLFYNKIDYVSYCDRLLIINMIVHTIDLKFLSGVT